MDPYCLFVTLKIVLKLIISSEQDIFFQPQTVYTIFL